MPQVIEIKRSDLDFLIEQMSGLTDARVFERVSDFVERVRYLSADLTPFPGKFSYKRFPYFRKIVNLFSPDDPTQMVVFMKGNQMASTTSVLEPVMLYNIMANPKSQMFVTADAGLMKTSVQIKIEKMIDSSGARHLIFSQNKKSKGSKDSGDTGIAKEYPGGYLHCFGGKSPSRFRGMSYRAALVSEVDAFPAYIKNEGTVIDLIMNRLNAYSGTSKILLESTPLVEQTSLIYRYYLEGDQQKYHVPCKNCGFMQELVWHGVTENGLKYGIVFETDKNFTPKLETVGYKCPNCGFVMKNHDKSIIMEKGDWIPTAEPSDPFTHSFHGSPLYNPPGMFSWEDMARLWAQCWDVERNRVKDKEKYRVFRNTKQGLPFKESGEQIRYEKAMLHRRYGFVRGKVPNDLAEKDAGTPVLIIIASVDVQKHNLFVDIKGYSAGGATWTIDFFSIDGETEDFGGPWDVLADYFENTVFQGTDGKKYRIAIMLVDSGKYTDYVYAFCSRYSSSVYACKGTDYIKAGETYKLFDKSTLQRIGLPLAYHINTTKLKDRISRSLNSLQWDEGDLQPTWYPNFPDDFRDDYFRMFEAENKVDEYDRKTNKYLRTIWKQRPGADNHSFDSYVYNLAGLEIFADDICRNELGINYLDWMLFWEFAKSPVFHFT